MKITDSSCVVPERIHDIDCKELKSRAEERADVTDVPRLNVERNQLRGVTQGVDGATVPVGKIRHNAKLITKRVPLMFWDKTQRGYPRLVWTPDIREGANLEWSGHKAQIALRGKLVF